MRFLFIDTDYPLFIRDWYEARPGLEDRPYAEQLVSRMESLFGMADFYSRSLRNIGHEAQDIIVNHPHLQAAWARERGMRRGDVKWSFLARGGLVSRFFRWLDARWMQEVLVAQVREYKPDVLFCMNIGYMGSDILRSLRGYYRIAVGQHAAALPGTDISAYDLMLSSLPNQVEHFRRQGLKSEYLRLGFEESVLDTVPCAQNRSKEAVFVGGITAVHGRATSLLEHLCAHTPVEIYGYGVEIMPGDSPVRKRHGGRLWGRQMFELLGNAKIALNRHIDAAENYANNMRLYESTGMGAMLLTDEKTNLGELFDVGREVVTYRTPEECAEKIEHYLAHDEEREAIARGGQQRTLREHTYRQRAQELLDIVGRYL